LAPLMATIYVGGALIVILMNVGDLVPSLALIFREAFNPSAGVAGTGIGAILVTLMWGVRRGLFSNEAGQGSAPIAHSAAKTDEPVSEGVVALLEPFIDTIIICTMTGLVIVATGSWEARVPTAIGLNDVNISYVTGNDERGYTQVGTPAEVAITNGQPATPDGVDLAYFDVAVEQLFIDAAQTQAFSGTIYPAERRIVASD